MTSKDLVRKAIRKESPERLPVLMGTLGISDTAGIPVRTPRGFVPATPHTNEWSCARTDVNNIDADTWHHLAVRADLSAGSDNIQFYLNGAQEGSWQTITHVSIQNTAGNLALDATGANNENFYGMLDEIRIVAANRGCQGYWSAGTQR